MKTINERAVLVGGPFDGKEIEIDPEFTQDQITPKGAIQYRRTWKNDALGRRIWRVVDAIGTSGDKATTETYRKG